MNRRTKIVASAVLALAITGSLPATLLHAAPTTEPAGDRSERPTPQSVSGTVDSYNLSPRGTPVGLLIKSSDKIVQLNVPPDAGIDLKSAAAIGATVQATGMPDRGPGPDGPAGPPDANGPRGRFGNNRAGGPAGGPPGGPHGPQDQQGQGGANGPGASGRPPFVADHEVLNLATLTGADGKTITIAGPEDWTALHVEGTIKSINYTPKGEVDGAVLDTGDFVHIHGGRFAASLQLKPGDKLTADGKAVPMAGGHNAVDAEKVNGTEIPKPPAPRGPQAGPRDRANNRGPNGPGGPADGPGRNGPPRGPRAGGPEAEGGRDGGPDNGPPPPPPAQ